MANTLKNFLEMSLVEATGKDLKDLCAQLMVVGITEDGNNFVPAREYIKFLEDEEKVVFHYGGSFAMSRAPFGYAYKICVYPKF